MVFFIIILNLMFQFFFIFLTVNNFTYETNAFFLNFHKPNEERIFLYIYYIVIVPNRYNGNYKYTLTGV